MIGSKTMDLLFFSVAILIVGCCFFIISFSLSIASHCAIFLKICLLDVFCFCEVRYLMEVGLFLMLPFFFPRSVLSSFQP